MRKISTKRARKNVFNWALGIARNDESRRNDTLHWMGELQEIDPTSFLQVKIKVRYNRKSNDVFNLTSLAILNATMRHGFDFRLTFSSPLNATKQRRFFSSTEHQTNGTNFKLTEFFNLCHIDITKNHRYDMSWKLGSISGFRRLFDVPCVKRNSTEWGRKTVL
jgi:hypothetical protein